MASATIKLFLPHGDPKRLRTAEISNWSGKAVAGRIVAGLAGLYLVLLTLAMLAMSGKWG